MPTVIDWSGTTVAVREDGTLDLAVAGERAFVRALRVGFDEPWIFEGQRLLVDEVEQTWANGHVTATVRHVFDQSWSIRVQVVNLRDTEVKVSPPKLEFTSSWPARRWLAGAEGQLSFDPGRADGALLTLTQLRGRSRLSEGTCWLADLPIHLGVAGSSSAQLAISWRGDWLRDEAMQAGALPGWWPDTVLDDGDVVLLDLPDAAIEAAGMTLLEDEAGTTLSARPGIHLAQVHSGHGTTDVEFAVAPSLTTELSARTVRILEGVDPRTCSPATGFVVLRAHGLGLAGDEALAFAGTVAEECAARPGPVAPFVVGLLANLALHEPRRASELPELLSRLVEGPGAGMARVQAALALQMAGEPVAIPPGVPAVLGEVEAAIYRLEETLIRAQTPDPVELRRVAGLLGAGLPGVTADARTRAMVHAVLGLAAEGLDVGGRWPMPLAQVRDMARKRLLAERGADEAIAWLLW